jgi:acid phosphatase type 7
VQSRRLVALIAVCALTALAFATGAAQGTPSAGQAVSDPRIAAAGDIACKDPPRNNRRVCRYDDVAALVARGDYDRFLALGDNQYEYGGLTDYRQNYDVYFGDLLGITRPVPGNHEYGTPRAAGYFRYFGALGHGPGGYYSFNLGAWHLIALNSAICPPAVGCGPGDPQYEWLKADLAANDARCTLAYWHHPRYDWLKYQNADWTEDYEFLKSAPFWSLLYDADADVVLNGHNHNYSHWLPMDDEGNYDPARGVTQFIAGTGGRNLNELGSVSTKPATFLTGQDDEFGVLSMTLHPTGYHYRFVSSLGARSSFIDQGNGACH